MSSKTTTNVDQPKNVKPGDWIVLNVRGSILDPHDETENRQKRCGVCLGWIHPHTLHACVPGEQRILENHLPEVDMSSLPKPGERFKWDGWVLEVLCPPVRGMVPCKVVGGPHCPMGVWWNFETETLATVERVRPSELDQVDTLRDLLTTAYDLVQESLEKPQYDYKARAKSLVTEAGLVLSRSKK